MEPLYAFFKNAGFTDSDAAHIAAAFRLKKIARGDFFVREGKTSNHVGFIEKGFFQYWVLVDGEEKTTYSLGPNNFVASLISFLRQVPAKENIRAVVDADLWVVERGPFRQLQKDIAAFKDFYIGLLEWQLCCIEESRLDGILLSAQQRYAKMVDKEPALLQDFPLQYLASILGVTPRHLSRIRHTLR